MGDSSVNSSVCLSRLVSLPQETCSRPMLSTGAGNGSPFPPLRASHLETSDASTGVGTADRKKRNPPNITHQSTTVPSSARIHRFLMT